MLIAGIDIGGTFTDLALYDSDRDELRVHKLRSTPADPGVALIDGIVRLCEIAGVAPGSLDGVLHGTTVATNAVLEHGGARTGLVTTEGMRDVVHIGRHQRPEAYSVMSDIPWQSMPFVDRANRIAVGERIAPPNAEVITPLDEDGVREAAQAFKKAGVEAVAVCFLFSYIDDTHEQRAAEILSEEMPDAFITTSASVSPQFREFERFTTACMNAFVGPRTGRYLENLSLALRERGIDADLNVMRSNGGLASAQEASERPVTLILSGPAAGVLGASWVGSLVDRDKLITFDMGGTSADIGLVTGGAVHEASGRDTQVAGYPLLVPMFDIETIGSGGGSIARVDAAGAFRVGPQSAGADPGPACYGNGGDEPTVTDAHLVLGRLDHQRFLGGDMELQVEEAERVIDRLGEQIGLGRLETAAGILKVANARMAQTVRAITVERGQDPRTFTLVAFGGAGPLHAAELADMLEIPEVLIPPHPGIMSAAGLLTSDLRYDLMRTVLVQESELDAERIAAQFEELEDQLLGRLARDGGSRDSARVERFLDCRYSGQGYELRVPLARHAALGDAFGRFREMHRAEYGHATEDPVEIVNLRVRVTGHRPKLTRLRVGSGELSEATVGQSNAAWTIDDELVELATPHLLRAELPIEQPIAGPAIVLQRDTTIVVPPGWSALATPTGPLMLQSRTVTQR